MMSELASHLLVGRPISKAVLWSASSTWVLGLGFPNSGHFSSVLNANHDSSHSKKQTAYNCLKLQHHRLKLSETQLKKMLLCQTFLKLLVLDTNTYICEYKLALCTFTRI